MYLSGDNELMYFILPLVLTNALSPSMFQSYMEDHLKNKDRLDQEWEGLVAYEAEPSSTGTGGDAPNVRKNRYSDILPCKYTEHSL